MVRYTLDKTEEPKDRAQIAGNVAQYLHPKLKAVEHSGKVDLSPWERLMKEIDDKAKEINDVNSRRDSAKPSK